MKKYKYIDIPKDIKEKFDQEITEAALEAIREAKKFNFYGNSAIKVLFKVANMVSSLEDEKRKLLKGMLDKKKNYLVYSCDFMQVIADCLFFISFGGDDLDCKIKTNSAGSDFFLLFAQFARITYVACELNCLEDYELGNGVGLEFGTKFAEGLEDAIR